jgi:hypothetical protein
LDTVAPWRQDVQPIVYYPNPLTEENLTVRFYSETDRPAQLVIYNVEGEVVSRHTIQTSARQVNEELISLPQLASGVYICQLERETDRGVERSVSSLAVAR